MLEALDRQALVDLIFRQAEQVGELRGEIEKLKKANEHLHEKLETSPAQTLSRQPDAPGSAHVGNIGEFRGDLRPTRTFLLGAPYAGCLI